VSADCCGSEVPITSPATRLPTEAISSACSTPRGVSIIHQMPRWSGAPAATRAASPSRTADRIDEEASILDRIRRGERVDHFETDRQRKDATVFPVSISVSPIHDDLGTIIGVSKIARDLSASHRTHRELRSREVLLRSILDTVADALIVIDGLGQSGRLARRPSACSASPPAR
jgi:PAS domain-containing protein